MKGGQHGELDVHRGGKLSQCIRESNVGGRAYGRNAYELERKRRDFAFQPFSSNNALLLPTGTSGFLTLAEPISLSSLALYGGLPGANLGVGQCAFYG